MTAPIVRWCHIILWNQKSGHVCRAPWIWVNMTFWWFAPAPDIFLFPFFSIFQPWGTCRWQLNTPPRIQSDTTSFFFLHNTAGSLESGRWVDSVYCSWQLRSNGHELHPGGTGQHSEDVVDPDSAPTWSPAACLASTLASDRDLWAM